MRKESLSIEDIRRAVAPIAERHGVDSIVLFGSAARGEDGDDSDYDFCVDSGRIKDYDELAHLIKEIEEAIRFKVDVITLGGIKPNSRLMSNIRRDGIVLYTRTA